MGQGANKREASAHGNGDGKQADARGVLGLGNQAMSAGKPLGDGRAFGSTEGAGNGIPAGAAPGSR